MFADFVVKYTQRSSIKIKKQKEAVSKAKHPRSRGFVIRARKVYLNTFNKIQFLTIYYQFLLTLGTGTERISALSLRISERSG